MAVAPSPVSSAGWPIRISVPRHRSLLAAISFAVPYQLDICTSWPQACITGTVTPSLFVVVTLLAYGKPVFSSTGRASMSVLSSTVATPILQYGHDPGAAHAG